MDFLNILDLFIHANYEGDFNILAIYKLNLFPFIPDFYFRSIKLCYSE